MTSYITLVDLKDDRTEILQELPNTFAQMTFKALCIVLIAKAKANVKVFMVNEEIHIYEDGDLRAYVRIERCQ